MFGLALLFFSMCFFCPLAFRLPCLGKRELVFVFKVHLFVSYVNLCHFFSSSWCRGWLRLLLVALTHPLYILYFLILLQTTTNVPTTLQLIFFTLLHRYTILYPYIILHPTLSLLKLDRNDQGRKDSRRYRQNRPRPKQDSRNDPGP